MKILEVMPEFPFPPDAGCRADTLNRLRAMARAGHCIDSLVMQQKRLPEERHLAELRGVVNSLQFVARQPLHKCLATSIPTTSARHSTLAGVRLRGEYDLTIAEGESVFSIFDNPALQTRIRVLRVHNDESRYMWAHAKTEESFVRRQFCRLEALRFLAFSRTAYRRVDYLWFISQSERQKYVAAHPTATGKAVWVPPAIAFGQEPKRDLQSKHVLFVASLNSSLNREGLRWYLDHVHPRLTQDPHYSLVVAGSTSGRDSAHAFVKELQQQSCCSVHVNVADLTGFYSECAVFVNPMRRGTGLKLKNVHAIERRMPVVTTSVGNDGSGFSDKEHVRIADMAPDFASAVAQLLNDKCLAAQMAARAYRFLAEHYQADLNLCRLFARLALTSEKAGSNSGCGPAARSAYGTLIT